MAFGGAAGAALGGWSACQASKWEFFVFLKGNRGFLKVGGLPGAPRREVLGPLGALRGASGRSLGAGGSFQGARRALEEILGALGSSFGGSGDILGDLGVDFFILSTQ